MEFLLTFNQPAEVYEQHQHPVQGPPMMSAWRAYMDAVAGAGVLRGGNRLAPPHTATTVRMRDGRRQVQDGPFADTHELLGGYIVIDVPSLDEALQWAARSPSALLGSTEVRPTAAAPR